MPNGKKSLVLKFALSNDKQNIGAYKYFKGTHTVSKKIEIRPGTKE